MMETDPYLLEKKGCTIEELQSILQKYYTVFLDLSLDHPTQIPIQQFPKFYKDLQQSKIQHKDILFLKP